MSNNLGFTVEAIEPVSVTGPAAIEGAAFMSPYVWKLDHGKGYGLLVRVVPPAGTPQASTGSIWYGESSDGLAFKLDDKAVICPGPDPLDIGGCEDPTLILLKDRALVYYTGVDASGSTGQLLLAQGKDVHHLDKTSIALASSKTEGNTKEASIDRTTDGHWRLFYEYARNEASLVGLATGESEVGPWTEQPQPFAPRTDAWDSWHLSTGPLLTTDKDMPVMFYNGATRDARWRIGWVAFDAEYTRVVDRCLEPLIVPPPQPDRTAADIAFAASLVADGNHAILYYSLADARLERARIRRFRF
jgi:predicted GH43/DUF377 family glycosyl hydrolase